jgi:hypothetical protein
VVHDETLGETCLVWNKMLGFMKKPYERGNSCRDQVLGFTRKPYNLDARVHEENLGEEKEREIDVLDVHGEIVLV